MWIGNGNGLMMATKKLPEKFKSTTQLIGAGDISFVVEKQVKQVQPEPTSFKENAQSMTSYCLSHTHDLILLISHPFTVFFKILSSG